MTPYKNWSFALDRFNNSNSSIFFNTGYSEVPSGVYFDGGIFTVSLWIKTIKVFWQSILDFGNTNITNNVIFQLDQYNNPNVQIINKYYYSSPPLVINEWNHMATVLNGTKITIYLNGLNLGSQTVTAKPLNQTRSTCFIGRSNGYYLPNNPDSIAYLDDIKIYNRALSDQEIINDVLSGFYV